MSVTKSPLGCLLIHGFTSHRSSLEAVIPELDKRNIPWHYPILAGHGSTPKELQHVTWDMWQRDVEQSLEYLRGESDRVVLIALSMGSLLALELAEKHPDVVAGVVLLSPCLRFYARLSKYTPIISRVLKRFPNPSIAKFSSLEYAKRDKGYLWFPTIAFRQYWIRTQHFDSVLENIHQPIKIIHSKKDRVADPSGGQHIFDTVASKHKELIWLEKSGHEVLLDLETDRVLKYIFEFEVLRSTR